MVWVASIMLPLLSLGLPSGTCHWSNLKAHSVTGLTTMKRESKWRVEKGSNWFRNNLVKKKGQWRGLEVSRRIALNAVDKGEEWWLGALKDVKGEFSGSGTQSPLGCAHNSSNGLINKLLAPQLSICRSHLVLLLKKQPSYLTQSFKNHNQFYLWFLLLHGEKCKQYSAAPVTSLRDLNFKNTCLIPTM